jgi:hypothetical protein
LKVDSTDDHDALGDLMPTDLPIACSLRPNQLAGRLAAMADLGRDALVDVDLRGGQATLRFAAGFGVHERVAAIAAAESGCCAFLTMQVCDEPDAVVLHIAAPEGGELALHELVEAFHGEQQLVR